jgi:hypothetical protein
MVEAAEQGLQTRCYRILILEARIRDSYMGSSRIAPASDPF